MKSELLTLNKTLSVQAFLLFLFLSFSLILPPSSISGETAENRTKRSASPHLQRLPYYLAQENKEANGF